MFIPNHVSHVTCHRSHVMCQVSHVMCQVSLFLFKWWSLLVEGLLSIGPTLSSFLNGTSNFTTAILAKPLIHTLYGHISLFFVLENSVCIIKLAYSCFKILPVVYFCIYQIVLLDLLMQYMATSKFNLHKLAW